MYYSLLYISWVWTEYNFLQYFQYTGICVRICIHMYVLMTSNVRITYTCVHACGSQRSTSRTIPQVLSTFMFYFGDFWFVCCLLFLRPRDVPISVSSACRWPSASRHTQSLQAEVTLYTLIHSPSSTFWPQHEVGKGTVPAVQLCWCSERLRFRRNLDLRLEIDTFIYSAKDRHMQGSCWAPPALPGVP